MERIETDILVIGAGSGGLSVAAGAVQLGARVVLLEGGRMGGDCLNYGCVPSKALIAAGKHAHAMTTGAPFGVAPVVPQVDFARVKDHVAEVIAGIAPHDSVERFEGLGVRVITEYGRFISRDEVQAGETVIRARRIVIATGSSPLVPPIPGLDSVPYYTNETIFDLREKPGHLVIIGGGPIGLEMAQAHRRLGSEVTVLEGEKSLGKEDPELAGIVLDRQRGESVTIVEGAMAGKVSGSEGDVTVETDSGTYSGTHLLVAVGRVPNVERLDLATAGIKHDRAGIQVDSGLRTSNRKVYAIGDVAGGMQFTHVAGYHAGVVIRSALFGLPSKASTAHIPWVTFTDPEIAQVGLTEAQAREKYGDRLEVIRFPYAENDRARAERVTEGLIKVMVTSRGRPVGVSIVGAQAGEHIQLWSLVLANGLRLGAVASMVSPYPVLGEISKRAAGQYYAPRLFENQTVKKLVQFVQRHVP
jgi:pyruvate/2-oxoglutarate dehydrogenase complex dihydrolipoamide dehydrogenase (E3) component